VQRFEDRVPPEQVAIVRAYTGDLIEKVSAAISESVRNLAPAQLEFGQSLAGIAVNRRRVANPAWPGPVDHDVPVLAVRGPGGNLRAVVVGYACHNTTLRHPVPKLPLSLTTAPLRPNLFSIRDSIAAATHLLQTFRLDLQDSKASSKLHRLAQRLRRINQELEYLSAPENGRTLAGQ